MSAHNSILIIVQNLPVPFDRRVWQEPVSLRRAGYEVSVICPKKRMYTKGFERSEGIDIYRYAMLHDADAEPMKLGPKAEYSYQITLELPAKYTAHAPLAFSLKRDYAEYEATYKVDGNVFTAGRKLILRQDELPVARASD